MTDLLRAEQITYGYTPGHRVLHGVSLSVGAGEVLFLLGANGSGKTTLLDCLTGVRAPDSGRIYLESLPLDRLHPSERARRIGLVPQLHEPVFDYTVEEIVTMGRAPHLGPFSRPSARDRDAVFEAMESVGVGPLHQTRYTQISGGERQIVLIARGLAQGAHCLLMDEPAAHLDPRHQEEVFAVVRRLAGKGRAFVISSHQPNSALLHAGRVALLLEGRIFKQGTPGEVLTCETLQATYGTEFTLISDGTRRAALPAA